MEGGEWRFLFLDHVKINQDRAPESQRGRRCCLQQGHPSLYPTRSPKLVCL